MNKHFLFNKPNSIICIILILVFFIFEITYLEAAESKEKIKNQLSGSMEFGIEYIDIDYYLNNTSYSRGQTYNYRFMSAGNLFGYTFSGLGNFQYNHLKQQKSFYIESLRLEFAKPYHSFLIGHFFPQYSELTLFNQKLEGLNFKLEKYDLFKITGFGGISNEYEKITDVNSTAEYQQYLYGARVDFDNNIGNLYISSFRAIDDAASIDTGTPVLGPIENLVSTIGYNLNLFDSRQKFNFEYSRSKLDKNRKQDDIQTKKDFGVLSNIESIWSNVFKTNIVYKSFGKNYYSAGNTALNASEIGYRGFTANYEYNPLDKLNITGFLENYYEDGFETSTTKTKHKIWDNTIKHKLNEANELSLNTYWKDTYKEDATVDKLKTSVKVSYTKKINTAKIGGNISYSKTDDKTLANSDTKVKGFSLNFADKYFNKKLFLSAICMTNRTEMSTGFLNFFMTNINLNAQIKPAKLLASANLSYQLNSGSTSELSRIYTNKATLKYYLTLEKSLEFELKNDRKFADTGIYNVWLSSVKYNMIF